MPAITARFVDCHVFRWVPDVGGGRRDEWLLLRRAPGILLGGTWQMVSGHIEDGETAYQAAYRELGEETGLVPLRFYQASYVNRFYLAESDQIILSPVFCAEVAPGSAVRLSDEHTEHLWVTADEADRRLPWPGQRRSLSVIREQFVLREPLPQSRIDALVARPRVEPGKAREI